VPLGLYAAGRQHSRFDKMGGTALMCCIRSGILGGALLIMFLG
jgi:hypothetical protein